VSRGLLASIVGVASFSFKLKDMVCRDRQGSYPIRKSKFPDISLSGSQKHPIFPDPYFAYLQKEIKKVEPDR